MSAVPGISHASSNELYEETDSPAPVAPRTSHSSSNEHCADTCRDQPAQAVPGTSGGSSISLHTQYDHYVDLLDEDQDPDFLAALEASLLDEQAAT